jgi:4-amino-4-deoxy-L-arabinose transferase-like glycosyltransferase
MNWIDWSPENFLRNRRALWIIAALLIALFAIANLPWQLDDYDQAKQAFTSFQMVKEGRWFYQQTPHERVATKPPLVGWISAGLFAGTRSWDLAWRLPSFLAALAIAILLFRTAALAYGPLAGLVALSAFGFNLLTPRLGTLVRTDMPLAFVISLIGLKIWKHAREQRGWERRDRVLLFLLLTGAMLIKGPIVYAFIFPGVLAFVWSLRKTPKTARGCGWWPWVASLAIFLLWVIGGIIFESGFFHQVVMREFLGRFGTTVHKPKEFFFYLPHLLHKFFPWSVLMIVLAIVDLRARRWKLRSILREISPETFWLICWVFGGLVVMSLIPSKRVDRIFPVIPPLCLLLAAQIGKISADEEWRERIYRWSAAALLLSILFSGGYSVFKVISGYRENRDALVAFGRGVRKEAAAHHWRLEAVRGYDEGMLLYLERPHFITPERAVTEWNGAQLDALVVPTEEAPDLMRQMRDAALSQLHSAERKNERGMGYVLITR